MRGPGLGTAGIIQSLELHSRLRSVLLQRIGKCISFGCPPSERGRLVEVCRRVSDAYPRRILERGSCTHSDPIVWVGAPPKSGDAAVADAGQVQAAAEEAAKLSNRRLLATLLKQSLPESLDVWEQQVEAQTVHLHTQMAHHPPSTPSSLVSFSRFGTRQHERLLAKTVLREEAAKSLSSVPENWIAWHLMCEHPLAIVMQSFVFSMASRQFVAVVEETLAVEKDDMPLVDWIETKAVSLEPFIERADKRRLQAQSWWRETLSMLRVLEQKTWDRPDAVEDMG